MTNSPERDNPWDTGDPAVRFDLRQQAFGLHRHQQSSMQYDEHHQPSTSENAQRCSPHWYQRREPPRRLSQNLTMPEFCLVLSAMAAITQLKSMQRTWGTCGSCRRVDPNRARVRRSRPLGSSFLLPASVLTVKNTRGNFAFSSIGTMPTMRRQDRPRCLVGRSGRLRQARKRVRDPWPRRELPSPAFPGR